MMAKVKNFIRKNKRELIIFSLAFLFSWWLMFSTFSYSDSEMKIASKAWSDFASHIPLIRSFSFGDNFPPQYPLFSGPPIKYHFLFFALAGVLEKLGLRIDYAFNIPSVFGFSFLLLMMYIFAKEIFKSKVVGILSIVFFLFNGTLSFLNFFAKYPLSQNTFFDIISNLQFPSFAPYGAGIVSAFWNLNIYTNQRHLALSYAVSILIIYLLIKPFLENKILNFKKSLIIGMLFGLSLFLNIAVFLMTGIILTILLLLVNKNRKNIFLSAFVGGIVAIPQYLYTQTANSNLQIAFYPGYLINSTLTVSNFLNYWFNNLGLNLILIPFGFIFAPKKAKIILISFFSLFVVGNLFKFSPEVAANHKFFNYFMLIGVMFSAYFLVFLWNKKIIFRPLIPFIIFFLILSGIIDFFPIYNDSKIALADYPKNKDVLWIMKNTKPDSVFLNTQYLYDNASLAGRKIFLGWPYFAWSQGYDTNKRNLIMSQMLGANNKNELCFLLKANNIGYIEINGNNLGDPNLPRVSPMLESGLIPAYQNNQSNYRIYSVFQNCQNL